MLHGNGEPRVRPTAYLFMSGYGVAEDQREDRRRYAREVLEYILEYAERRRPIRVVLFLSGCATDPHHDSLTEPMVLEQCIHREQDLYQAICRAVPDAEFTIITFHGAVDLRQGLIAFSTIVPPRSIDGVREVIIFSEMSWRWRVRAIAHKVLQNHPYKVVGIAFDTTHKTWEMRVGRYIGIASAVLSNRFHEEWYIGVELARRLETIGHKKKRRR